MSRSLFCLLCFAFLTAVVVAAQQTAPRPAAAPQTPAPAAQQQRAVITGSVTKSGSGEVIRKASVTLMPMGGGARQGGGQAQPGTIAGQQAQAGQPQQGQQAQRGAQPAPPNQVAQNGQQGQQAPAGGARSVTTGDDGAFVFNDVPPGTYRLRVDRDGYLSQEYGQRNWTGAGTPITVAAGQRLGPLAIQMTQGGTITGRILDENLEPVTGIQVQALAYVYQNGSRTLTTERQVQTNDLGEYRLYWLTPGDHFVSAIPNSRRGGLVQAAGGGPGGRGNPFQAAAGSTEAAEETYAATFFPGGTDPETASPVRISVASEVRGIDFVLRPTPTVRISGRVASVDVPLTQQQLQAQAQRGGRGGNNGGRGGGGGGRVQVVLTRIGASTAGARGGRGGGPNGPGGGGGRGAGALGIQFAASTNPDGTFEIANVIPGAYNLIAIQQVQNQVYSTRMRVDVGRANLEGLSLAVRPGVEIPGQFYFEGTPPANFQANRLRVQLTSQDNLPLGNTNAQVDAAGKFALANVPAMTYRVQVQGLPAGAYLIAGRYGSADALGEALEVDQASPLALQIGFNPGQVGGTVMDNTGQPFQGAIAALIPSARSRVDLYKTSTSDAAGKISFTGVAPGDYKVIAWEDIPQGAYLNADFVAPFEDRAQTVHVDRDSAPGVQVRVIPKDAQ